MADVLEPQLSDSTAARANGEQDEGTAAPEFQAPRLSGRAVYLRPISPDDYVSLRMIELGPELGVRWRFRGATPGLEQWVRENNALLVHYMVVRHSDHKPIGTVFVYNQNFQDRYAYFALASLEPSGRSPLLMGGAGLCIEYAFTCWAFRKLYLETPEYNVEQFAGGVGKLFTEEGRLRDHLYYGGRYWDMLTFALYRRTWESWAPRWLAANVPAQERVATVSLPSR